MSILMIGITGHGKSALSNFIFQEDVFQSDLGFLPVTLQATKRSKTIQGVNFNIVDTVGFSDDPSLQEHHLDQIGSALDLFSNGIDAIIFVIKSTERFSVDISIILTGLGNADIWDHCFVAFTNSKELANTESGQISKIKQMLANPSCPESLTSLMKIVNNRYMVVESLLPMGDDYHMNKMNEIIKMIKCLKTKPYTNEMFQIAFSNYKKAKEKAEINEAKLLKQKQSLELQMKQFEEKIERHEKEIERDKKEKERMEKERQELQQKIDEIKHKLKKQKKDSIIGAAAAAFFTRFLL